MRRLNELFMSYIKEDKMGNGSKQLHISHYRFSRGLHAYETTDIKSQHHSYNIDRFTASVLHASPCLQLNITDGKEKAHSHTCPSHLTCFKPQLLTNC